jgi:hypothetical protein
MTKVDLDNRMGAMVVNLRAALLAPATFKAKFFDDATLGTDAFLQALGYTGSVSTGEIQTMRASFADMSKLNDIANAAATQSSTNDFWFNAKHLIGYNV